MRESAADWLPDDELTKEWQQAVEDYRRECDEADRQRILGDLPISGSQTDQSTTANPGTRPKSR